MITKLFNKITYSIIQFVLAINKISVRRQSDFTKPILSFTHISTNAQNVKNRLASLFLLAISDLPQAQ
jgi:hypothetical protein